jgi:hypothetical protein
MRAMKNFLMIVGLVFGMAACGSKADDALKEFEGFRDKMCKCTTKECTEKVEGEWREWRKNTKIKKSDLSKEQQERGNKIDDEMDACRDKVRRGGDAPKAEPAAEPKAETK